MKLYYSSINLILVCFFIGCTSNQPKNVTKINSNVEIPPYNPSKSTIIAYFQQYYNGEIEDPKNILKNADKLLKLTNEQQKQNWQLTASPNLFYQAQCKEALKIKWLEKLKTVGFIKGKSEFWSIIVSCDKSTNIHNFNSGWNVRFITNRPNGATEKDFPDNVRTYVQEHLGNETDQGLKYVNDKAVELINAYNQQNHTHWKSLEPDARNWAEKCTVPLTAKWLDPSKDEEYSMINYLPNMWYVKVSCSKTVKSEIYPSGTNWNIIVPTTREIYPTPNFKEFLENTEKY